MSKQTITNETLDQFTLEGVEQRFSVVKFENETVKKELLKEAKSEAERQAIVDEHVVKLSFDFSGVSVGELVRHHITTTTLYKMWYNNHGKTELTEERIGELFKSKQAIRVNVREILDGRKKKQADPLAPLKRIKKLKEEGKLTDEMVAHMIAELQDMSK